MPNQRKYIDEYVKRWNISQDFIDGLKIRAICEEYNLTLEDAARQSCLMVEIYQIAKRCDGKIIEHIEEHKDIHLTALDIMTDREKLKQKRLAMDSQDISDSLVGESDAVAGYRFLKKLIIIEELEKADAYLKSQCGVSNFFTSQLENSRRLYTDPDFREQQVNLYLTQIEPRLTYYSLDRVADIFEHFGKKEQEKQDRIKQQFFYSK
jgi:hypothetical protein